MKCNEFEELLSDYLENRLGPEMMKAAGAHIKECPDCAAVSGNVDHIVSILPELNREIPFFLKNRLYLIGTETEEETVGSKNFMFIKWIAAVIGTAVLFLNLFYFTNIFPAANKTLHTAVAGIENFIVEAEAFIGRIKETNNMFLYKKTGTISKTNKKKEDAKAKNKSKRGFEYG